MKKRFESNDRPLHDMLREARSGQLQLPNFQRGFVWNNQAIKSLIASLSHSFPIGAVMVLETGSKPHFAPRNVKGVHPKQDKEKCRYLLLDGQQRITALYQALFNDRFVETKDRRKKEKKVWYYVHIPTALDEDKEREEAIIDLDENRKKTHGRATTWDCSTQELEIERECFPLNMVFDGSAVRHWGRAYVGADGVSGERWKRWDCFCDRFLDPVTAYQLPVIQLAHDTPNEAVCAVFEKVNTGGVTLTVFELLTAIYAAEGHDLKKEWERKRKPRLKKHKLLDNVEKEDFLQIVTLLASYERRVADLEKGLSGKKVAAVGCRRPEILKLPIEQYRSWADQAEEGLLRIPPLMHEEHLYNSHDLPYASQRVPLAAILAILGRRADELAVKEKLLRWYWCGVFGELYGSATETRFAFDLPEGIAWVEGGEEPRTVREASFDAGRLLTLKTRNSAAYKGLYALQMRAGGLDFRTGRPINVAIHHGHAIDIHHIFPQKWCNEQHIDPHAMNCIVNKTPIDSSTNQIIGGDAPSVYLGKLVGRGIDPTRLDEILLSHHIAPSTLRADDFPSFFNKRFDRLISLVAAAMGKAVTRTEDRDESPYAESHDLEGEISALVKEDEGPRLELKGTGRYNSFTNGPDAKLEDEVVLTVTAFLNSRDGGDLLIGVRDDKSIRGIEEDFNTFTKHKNRDGFLLWLRQLLEDCLDKMVVPFYEVGFATVDEKTVCRVRVEPCSQPVFVQRQRAKKNAKINIFYLRETSSSVILEGQRLVDYLAIRWPGWSGKR